MYFSFYFTQDRLIGRVSCATAGKIQAPSLVAVSLALLHTNKQSSSCEQRSAPGKEGEL